MRRNMRNKVRRQILCAPTGSGKTEIAMSIIKDAEAKGSRVVFICDRQTLVNQTSERFAAAGIRHGVAMGDSTFGRGEKIQVVSAQTAERRGFLMAGSEIFALISIAETAYATPAIDLAIWDECDEVRERMKDMLLAANIRTIGMTATPFREGLSEIYEDVVNVITTNELLQDGYLCPFDVIAPDSEVDIKGTNWSEGDLSKRVLQIVGDIVPEWEKQCAERYGEFVPTICFCVSVADAEETAERFQEAGHDFRVVHYKQNSEQKQEIINRFRDDVHIGLINVRVLTKGFDAPATKIMIDAQPTRSFRLHIQKIGRLIRTFPGKERATYIDHAGNYLAFYHAMQAFFAAGCQSLKDGKLDKVKRQKKEDQPDIRCGECGFILPPRSESCPSCGADRRRKISMMTALPGTLKLIDSVEGEKGSFDGDWWEELRKVATDIHPMDHDRARKMALASYKGLFYEWPKGQFELTYGDPHPVVKEVSRRKYQEWLIAKRKGKAA